MKIVTCLCLFAMPLLIGGCGIITAPFSVASAVASNASFTFKGKVVDETGKPLEGVVADVAAEHRFWTPLRGSATVYDHLLRRVDGDFQFEVRGSDMEIKFTKDGYAERSFKFYASEQNQVRSAEGRWPNATGEEGFAVVMPSTRVPEAPLAMTLQQLSYDDYPMAESISLLNVATNGQTGDIKLAAKDAEDPTLFPAGTLYLTLDKTPPIAKDEKGNIDPAELDVPAKVMLHLPGPQSGFIRIAPAIGYHPLTATDLAPAQGYAPTLTIDRARLKAMRQTDGQDIIGAYEYFFFRTGNRYGKGYLAWATHSGKPRFEFRLYVQKRIEDRNLTLRTTK